MTLTVEDASIKSLERLYQIEKECFVEEAFTKKQISLLLTDYNSVSLMAKENGEIVGFIVAMIYPDRKTINGHILTIDVSPSYRRRGVGEMLLEEMEKIFVQKGVQVCLLEVKEGNVAAIGLYRKLGYEEIGRLQNYYGKADGIYLRKILPKVSKGLG
ncbi:MAG: ribosomal protein S18-alanine N-acetyltransferase [Candidatus Bathyarchaeia archaeon]|jgi:ribosomal-protein-alanine N-acetyltransferase